MDQLTDVSLLRHALIQGGEGHFTFTPQHLSDFERYYQLILQVNAHTNLTRITQPEEVAQRHFLDSLSPVLVPGLLPKGAKLIDVGSGAGFPGIPLGILRRDLKLTLLDSSQKRVDFLRLVSDTLGLDATAVHQRSEDAAKSPQHRAQYDIAVSRAVARLCILCEYLVPFLKVGGRAICMKGAAWQQELDEAQPAIRTLGAVVEKTIHMPFGGDEHHIIVLQKTRQTPAIYPRRAGQPERTPILADEPARKSPQVREKRGR